MSIATLCLVVAPAVVSDPASGPADETLTWFDGTYAEALEHAAAADKPVFVEFWTAGCGWCERFRTETLADETVARALEDFVCLSIDAGSPVGQELAGSFNLKAFPALFFLSSEAAQEDVIFGHMPPEDFVPEVARIAKGEATFSDLERRIAADPLDLQAHYDLADLKWRFGDGEGYYEHLHFIRNADPELHSLPMRRMVLGGLQEELFGCRMANGDIDFRPITEFMGQERHPELLFEGWSYLARVHAQVKDWKKASEAFAMAWRHVPGADVGRFGHELAWTYWKHRKDLAEPDRRFALEVARSAHEQFASVGGTKAEEAAYLDVLACSHYLNGNRDKAIELGRRSVELEPARRDYRSNVATFKLRK